MPANKYGDLSQRAQQATDQAQSHEPKSASAIASKEHTAPIIAHITYKTDLESDGLVRIYDGVTALRDEALLVNRKELVGKTPEQIKQHFSLSFLPKMICDAFVPLGHQIMAGKLTNAAGDQVYIFKALTALELSSERSLTPENIPPVKLK